MTKSLLSNSRRRGLSMTELLFAATMFGAAGMFVSMLLLEVARHSQTSLSMIPSELHSYRVLDRIRSELLAAEALGPQGGEEGVQIEGTPVVVDGMQVALEGNAVNFNNPARESRMRIWFEDGACLFTPDVDASEPEIVVWAEQLEDVTFRFPDRIDRRRVEIVVSSAATVSTVSRSRDRINTHRDVIMLRN
jgi:hypothetical protein